MVKLPVSMLPHQPKVSGHDADRLVINFDLGNRGATWFQPGQVQSLDAPNPNGRPRQNRIPVPAKRYVICREGQGAQACSVFDMLNGDR